MSALSNVVPWSLSAIFVFCAFILICSASNETYEYTTKHGTFLGVRDNTSIVFKGIQFAQAKRFQLAQEVKYRETDFINATTFGLKCTQLGKNFVVDPNESGENCLNLNIWVPESTIKDPSKKIPVMVFIHGGAFVIGSGSDSYIDGKIFNQNEVILVSLNYRMGIFGFLSYPYLSYEKNGVDGNLGIFDQREALIWIRHHISEFGGDTSNILIFGESAGAASVVYHLISKNEYEGEKLFHKAIILSTVDESLITNDCRDLKKASTEAVDKVGCYDPRSLEKSIKCLESMTAEELALKSGSFFEMRSLFYHTEHIGGPCIDSHYFPHSALHKISMSDWDHDVPLIFGNTANEGTLFEFLTFPFVSVNEEFMETILLSIYPSEFEQLFNIYPKTEYPSSSALLSDIVGDYYFNCFTRKLILELEESHPQTDIYRFVFEKIPQSGNQKLAAFHSIELPFIFHTTPGNLYLTSFTDSESKLSQILNLYLVNFAKSGNPNLPTPPLKDTTWEQYTSSTPNYLHFTDEVTLVDGDFRSEQCNFWNSHVGNIEINIVDELQHEPFISRLLNKYAFRILLHVKLLAIVVICVILLILYCGYRLVVKSSKPNIQNPLKKTQ